MSPLSSTTPEPSAVHSSMRVRKRCGETERVDLVRIVHAIDRHCDGLLGVDAHRIATTTIGGLLDGSTTRELDDLSIRTAAALTYEEPAYSKLAARLLSAAIVADVAAEGVQDIRTYVERGRSLNLLNERLCRFLLEHAETFEAALDPGRDRGFEYFGLRTLHDRYLLRHPHSRVVVETPQLFFLRVAAALSDNPTTALELYDAFSSLEYLPSSPTLFNAGTTHEQLSSCFLLDSPQDHLEDIYGRYTDVAMLSKFSGGIGLAFHRVRSRGSLIESTNGRSSGIVPWLKTLDASVSAVNQGGRRKGACCVYLEPWHADVEAFLELRNNTGDEAQRTHNLNLANWIPDLFMQRVQADAAWSLFDPKLVPELPDLWGDAFVTRYEEAERAGLATKSIPARALYARMMRTLAQTGNGWMTFKDACNRTCNQTAREDNVVHLSNLCTEIVEVSSNAEAAVCNLGSVNLAQHTQVKDSVVQVDFDKLARTVRTAVRQLNAVIDLNLYPIPSTSRSNARWRPVGLGVMGLQDVFFQMRLPFDSEQARALSRDIAERIYFEALSTSCELAEVSGPHPAFSETRAARGELQFDAWDIKPSHALDWAGLRSRVQRVGLRNSLLVAIAPTATIASIAGCYECIEPQISNLFKRETLSGDFLQVNRYLVEALRKQGLWTPTVRDTIKEAEGSVQTLPELSERDKAVFRTAWELPMRSLIDMAADRGAFVDQSQSFNLFVESPEIGRLSSMYFYAWKSGLKTTYYLRSRPATRIAKTTIREPDAGRIACSLENPTSCEACQ